MPAIAAMGRLRRHVCAVAICALICSGAVSPVLCEKKRLEKAIVLGLRVMKEAPARQTDQEELGAAPNGNDEVLLRASMHMGTLL